MEIALSIDNMHYMTEWSLSHTLFQPHNAGTIWLEHAFKTIGQNCVQ